MLFLFIFRIAETGGLGSLRYDFPMKTLVKTLTIVGALCAFTATSLIAQNITLPAPQKTGGMPLMEALAKRSSSREFDTVRELTPQQISNLLWAAFGINRDNGKRTAPSAKDIRETDIYVLLKTGSYVYDATAHALTLVVAGDKREIGGTQAFVKDAPVTLLLIADLTKAGKNGDTPANREMVSVDAGYISQNICLYCASEGLATGPRMSVDRAKIARELSLKPTQYFVIASSVGCPKKK